MLSTSEYLWVDIWVNWRLKKFLTENIFSSLPFLINYVYFWFSLIYLFGRTLLAQYLAACIHDATNYPLDVLKAVPYEGWCIEVQRFIDQIRSQTMAFSGYKFFYLTRKMILAVSNKNCLESWKKQSSCKVHKKWNSILDAGNYRNIRACSFAVWQRTRWASR